MSISLAFLGAAGTVTGSCYRVSHPGGSFLVDCGLFQGTKSIKELNYGAFPFAPERIDFVLLTHAHIDHSGLLPKLCKAGFDGRVYATEGTRDLLRFMLPDSGYIQESEVEHLNWRNARRGRPAVTPIYTRADAEACLGQITGVPLGAWVVLARGVRVRFWNAGHLLGSASVEIEIDGGESGPPVTRLLFSGDLGPSCATFHDGPKAPEDIDWLVMEGTYGDTERRELSVEERRARLREEVVAGLARGGNLIIPAFAVERTQELLFDLCQLIDSGALPRLHLFLDSPLAIRATEVFTAHAADLGNGFGNIDLLERDDIHYVREREESKRLATVSGAIIIAASGMCDAGRVRHHLRNNLWRPEASVLLVGYQVPGTLGSLLRGGAKVVRISGQEVAVKARIRSLDVYSGHADRSELLAWARARLPVRRGVFLTHGEGEALESLRHGLIELGLDSGRIIVPSLGETVELKPQGRPTRHPSARLAEPGAATADWHNDYAAFLIELQERLRAQAGDRQRDALLRRLKRALLPEAAVAPARRRRGRR